MKTTTRLKGLSALVAALPDLVGSEGAGAVIVLFERDGALAGVLGWADDACDGETAHMLDVVAERRATMGAQAAIAIAYRCEPGRVDIAALAKRIERRVPLHHVLGASDEHWWAIECELGCCDGAIHEIPSLSEQTREQMVEQGGLARSEKAREDDDGDLFVRIGELTHLGPLRARARARAGAGAARRSGPPGG